MRMRSIRSMLLLACTAVAFLAPAAASASWNAEGEAVYGDEYSEQLVWSQDGIPLTGEAGPFDMEGRFHWAGGLGEVDCPVELSGSLNPGSSGQIDKFTISAEGCEMSGVVSEVCTEVGSVTPTEMPWSVSTGGTDAKRSIAIEGIEMVYEFVGGECGSGFPIEFSGNLTATPDDAEEIGSVSLTGELASDYGHVAMLDSELSVDAPGGVESYGIFNQGSSNFTVDVSGALGWNGASGSMSCPVDGQLAVRSGNEAMLTSLVWDAAKCELSGAIAFTCGVNGVASVVSKKLPWPVVINGGKLTITEFPLEIRHANGCAGDLLTSGQMTATPNKAPAISSTALEGELSTGGAGNLKWAGSLGWSPAGVYGF
jgi:hypothetical protein